MPVELIHDGNASFNGDFLINGVRALTAEPTIESVVSAAIVTPNSAMSIIAISEQAEALFIANPTGTWSNGQSLLIRIEDDGSAQSIAFEDKYVPSGVSLPTTTIVGQILYLQIYYNSDSLNFDVVFSNQGGGYPSVTYQRLSDQQEPYLYLGYAPLGSSTASNVWFITRLTLNLDGSEITETASNVAWDNRVSVIYT
jgi:hypothetical protein